MWAHVPRGLDTSCVASDKSLSWLHVVQVHEELQAHDKTLSLFQNTQAVEWEGAVASHRLQLTSEFFDHVENLIHASHQDKQQREGKQCPFQICMQCPAWQMSH